MPDDFLKISDFSSVSRAVLSCEPAAFLINKGAEKLWNNHRVAARFLSSLQYVTNPLDRLIQMLVTPIFATASFVCVTRAAYGKGNHTGEGGKQPGPGYLGCRALVCLPSIAEETVCLWIPLILNAAIHVFPFIVISACKDSRPHNFFMRREYIGAATDWPLTFSLLISDKEAAQAFYLELLEDVRYHYCDGLLLEPGALINYEERVKEYESSLRRDGVQELINNLGSLDEGKRPMDGVHRKQVETGVFLDEMKKLFLAFYPRLSLYPDVNPMISFLEGCGGISCVFLLKEGMPHEEQVQEIRRRFGVVLERIADCSLLNSLRDGIFESSDEAEKVHSWFLELEAVFTYAYENFIDAAPAIKSARTHLCHDLLGGPYS